MMRKPPSVANTAVMMISPICILILDIRVPGAQSQCPSTCSVSLLNPALQRQNSMPEFRIYGSYLHNDLAQTNELCTRSGVANAHPTIDESSGAVHVWGNPGISNGNSSNHSTAIFVFRLCSIAALTASLPELCIVSEDIVPN
jgi:hypothetical protein